MSNPTRYPNGVSNSKNGVTSDMPILDSTIVHEYKEDFDTYTAANWTVTEVGTATQALTDEDGGVLLITNDANDDDSSFQQKVGESFLFETGKKLWFNARFKVSDATQSDFVMGLQITDTTPLSVTDGVYFRKDDADANIDFVVIKDSTATTSEAIAVAEDNTYINLGFYYNGKDKIEYFVDRKKVGTSVVTNLPDDEALTISFGIQNGEAVAKTMRVDYILSVKER